MQIKPKKKKTTQSREYVQCDYKLQPKLDYLYLYCPQHHTDMIIGYAAPFL